MGPAHMAPPVAGGQPGRPADRHELRARGGENLLYLTGLLDEAGVEWAPVGGNALTVDVAQLGRLDADQRAEVLSALRPGVVLPSVPPRVDVEPAAAPVPVAQPVVTGVAAAPPSFGAAVDVGPDPMTVAAVSPVDPDGAPPRTGPGATRTAWAAYATARGVPVGAGLSRDQIIELMEAHDGQ